MKLNKKFTSFKRPRLKIKLPFGAGGLVLADQSIFSGTSFLTMICLAKVLSPTEFGVFASILLANHLIISILNSLVIQPLQVNLVKIKDKESYLLFSFCLQISLMLILLILFLFLLLFLLPFGVGGFYAYSPLGLGVGFVLHDYFRRVFLADDRLKEAFILDAITSFFQILVLVYAFLYTLKLEEILLLFSLAYLSSFLYGISITFRKFETFGRYSTNFKSYFFLHLKEGKWLLMTALVQWWSSNLFVVFSGLFLGLEALGAFRLVQSLFGVLNILLQTFENYVLPQTVKLLKESPQKASKYLQNISLKSSVLFTIILSIIFLFAEKIMLLVGGKNYMNYAFVLKGMTVLYALIFLAYPIRIKIRALVLNQYFFVAYVISFTFSLLSFRFLLQNFQLMGAIFGLIVSQIILISFWKIVLLKYKF